MADYIGKECPACTQVFTKDDDIVVCPVCGTPQHRSCWMKESHCVNEALHADGFSWDVSANDKASNSSENAGQIKSCPYCHSPNKSDAFFCSTCGSPLDSSIPGQNGGQYGGYQGQYRNPYQGQGQYQGQAPFGGMPYGGAYRAQPVYSPFDQNEELDGVKVSEIAEYVRVNPMYYVNKFRGLISKGSKISINWACFFLSYIWWFSRKNYLMGTLTALLQVVFMILTAPYNNQLISLYDKGLSNPQAIVEAYPVMEKFILIYGILIVINFVIALFANYIYKKQVFAGIKKINDMRLPAEERQFTIARKGGMSILYGALAYLGVQIAANVILMLAEYLLELL